MAVKIVKKGWGQKAILLFWERGGTLYFCNVEWTNALLFDQIFAEFCQMKMIKSGLKGYYAVIINLANIILQNTCVWIKKYPVKVREHM